MSENKRNLMEADCSVEIEAGTDAKGQHVARISFTMGPFPDERIAVGLAQAMANRAKELMEAAFTLAAGKLPHKEMEN